MCAGYGSEEQRKAAAEYLFAKMRDLDDLPDRFSLSVFVNAGLPLEMASLALMAARRVLAETRRQ